MKTRAIQNEPEEPRSRNDRPRAERAASERG